MQFPLPLPPPPWVKQIPPHTPTQRGDASPPRAAFCSQAFVRGRGRDPPGFPQGPPCGRGPELLGVLSLRQEAPPLALFACPWRQEKGAAARPVPAVSPPGVTSPPAFGSFRGYPPGHPQMVMWGVPAPMGPQRRGALAASWWKKPKSKAGGAAETPAHQEPLGSLLISHPKSQGTNTLGRHHCRQPPSGAKSWGE